MKEASGAISRWETMSLGPELDTPKKRLSAILNIVQNGARTIMIFTMKSGRARTSHQLNSDVAEAAGGEPILSSSTAVKVHLGTASRFGVVSEVGKEWKLSEFGITMKPALVFFYQKLIDFDLNAKAIFGSLSKGKQDRKGNYLTTTPMTRSQILLTLKNDNQVRVIDLVKLSGIGIDSIIEHLRPLETSGLIEIKRADTIRAVTNFRLSDKADIQQIEQWSAALNAKGETMSDISNRIKQAITAFLLVGAVINRDTVYNFIQDQNKDGKKWPPKTVHQVLIDYIKKGFLEKVKFRKNYYSEISLTPIGKKFVEEILIPLSQWSQNASSVPEINAIAKRIRVNPNAFAYLYSFIAYIFLTNSPYKNKDPEKKIQSIVQYLTESPDKLTRADLSRLLLLSAATVGTAVGEAIKRGDISEQKAEKGKKKYLIPIRKP